METNARVHIALLRHGRTDWNVRRRLQGRTDVPLNEAGRSDAQRAAVTLRDEVWHAIYSSPLGRAAETAQIVSRVLGLPSTIQECLIERSYGALEGTTIRRRSRSSGRSRRPSNVPGMESDDRLRERAFTCLDGLAVKHLGQRIVVVSHGGFINAFLYRISQGKAGTGITRLANGSLTLVTRDSLGKWTIVSLNETSHLVDPQEPTFSHRPDSN